MGKGGRGKGGGGRGESGLKRKDGGIFEILGSRSKTLRTPK